MQQNDDFTDLLTLMRSQNRLNNPRKKHPCPPAMPLTTPQKGNARTEATFTRLRTAIEDMEFPSKASMTKYIAAGKTLDSLIATQSIKVEEVVTDFNAVRKQASTRKKPIATAA